MSSIDPGLGKSTRPVPEIPHSQPADRTPGRPRRKAVSPWLLMFLVILLVAAGAGLYWYLGQTPTIGIDLDEQPNDTAAKLHELNPDYDEGEIVALLEGPGPGPVPGTYSVDTDLDTVETVRALQTDWVNADPDLTFPEGFTVDKIAARIANNRWQYTVDGLAAAAEGLTVDPRMQRPTNVTSVEGLLFPSTYPVDAELDPSRTMGQMLVMMQSLVFDDLGIEQAAAELGRTPYELMTIASLIEKEAKTDGDRALISRVIYNRLDRDMLLQIDASNYYRAPEEATFPELRETDTPYNLYLYKGLPPTPIANPGRASIEAALHPAPPLDPTDPRCAGVPQEDCALLFYVVADADGNHAFAVTNEQHETNIEAARAAGVL